MLGWITQTYGWQEVFYITGGLGILWAVTWYLCYRDPVHSKMTNKAELDLIRQSGGLPDLSAGEGKKHNPLTTADFRIVLLNRKLWGVYFGQFALASTLWFFLTWFPTYLVTYRGMSFIKAGFVSMLPFVAAYVGVLCSGMVSDWLVRKGYSLSVARKAPIIFGLLLSAGLMGANYVDSPALVIMFMTIAFLGNGLASITWSLVSAIAPKRLIGLTGGIFNFCGAIAGFVIPVLIGYLVSEKDFSPALTFMAALAALGALAYIVVVGEVERLEDGNSA